MSPLNRILLMIFVGVFGGLFLYWCSTITTDANVNTEQIVVLDYGNQYYTMHCNALADILATEGSNDRAKRKIETYLEVTGAKTQ